MDLPGERERLGIVCDLVDRRVAGEVTVGAGNRVSDLLNTSTTANEFLSLTNVSVFDGDNRLVGHHRYMALNKRFIRSVVEDERTPVLEQVKHLLATDNLERAWDEVEYLLGNHPRDAETYYVAGMVAQAMGKSDTAAANFRFARGLATEEKFLKLIDGHLEAYDPPTS